jgi:hypothetical protein
VVMIASLLQHSTLHGNPGGRAGLRLWCECVVQPSSATDDGHEWGLRRNRSGRSALDCEEFVRRQVVGVLQYQPAEQDDRVDAEQVDDHSGAVPGQVVQTQD